jgi:hypothetical protein
MNSDKRLAMNGLPPNAAGQADLGISPILSGLPKLEGVVAIPPPPSARLREAELLGREFNYPVKGLGSQGRALVVVTDYYGMVHDKEGKPWEKVGLKFAHGMNEVTFGTGDAGKLEPLPAGHPSMGNHGISTELLGWKASIRGVQEDGTIRSISKDLLRVTLEFEAPQPLDFNAPGGPSAKVFEVHYSMLTGLQPGQTHESRRGASLGGAAFGIMSDDVFAVMDKRGARTNHDQAIEIVAENLARIERAALGGGATMDEQADAARVEIDTVLLESGFFALNGPQMAWRMPEDARHIVHPA